MRLKHYPYGDDIDAILKLYLLCRLLTGISFTDRTAFENFNAWNEGLETSDSEKLENDYENESLASNVHFMLGSTE